MDDMTHGAMPGAPETQAFHAASTVTLQQGDDNEEDEEDDEDDEYEEEDHEDKDDGEDVRGRGEEISLGRADLFRRKCRRQVDAHAQRGLRLGETTTAREAIGLRAAPAPARPSSGLGRPRSGTAARSAPTRAP